MGAKVQVNTETLPTVRQVQKWFEVTYATILFVAETGEQFTLVIRPTVAVLVADETAEVLTGTHMSVSAGKTELFNGDRLVWTATGAGTGIRDFWIAEN